MHNKEVEHLRRQVQALEAERSAREQAESLLLAQRDLAISLSSARDLSSVWELVFDTMVQIEHIDCAGAYLVDYNKQLIELVASRKLPVEFVERTKSYRFDSAQGQIVLAGKPVYQPRSSFPISIQEDLKTLGLECLVVLPVIYQKEVIAVVNLASFSDEQIPVWVRTTLESIAAQIGGSITRVRSIRELMDNQAALEQRVEERTRELTQAMRRLQESEEKSRNLINSSPMGIHTYEFTDDDELIFTGANASADIILGVNHMQFIGQTIEQAFPPLKETEIPDSYRNVCRTGIPWRTEQVDYEDEKIRGSYEVFAFRTAKNQMAVLFLDVTERHRAQLEREKLLEDLNRSRRMEAVGVLAGGVAHDLNNILSGIVSYPDLLLLSLPQDSDLRGPIETIRDSGNRAVAIVSDLLAISRGSVISKTVVDLNTIVREYEQSPDLIELRSLHPRVELDIHLDTELFNVRCSSAHLRKVLMNLVINGFDELTEGGKVTVSTSNCYIDKPLRGYDQVDVGEYVRLSVHDDGSGINPLDRDRIFEPFYTKKKIGRSGTGLGLAVVWNAVKDHDGYVNVSSHSDGTTFEIYLRATRETVDGQESESYDTALQGHGELILIVDDDANQRQITSSILQKIGYRAVAVADGLEGISYLNEHPVDLVVLDMIMPESINGLETYRRMLEIQHNLAAIIVSGFAKTSDVEATQQLGAGQFIKKPFSVVTIAQAIRQELRRKAR